jgi:hypothetical protein
MAIMLIKVMDYFLEPFQYKLLQSIQQEMRSLRMYANPQVIALGNVVV